MTEVQFSIKNVQKEYNPCGQNAHFIFAPFRPFFKSKKTVEYVDLDISK